MNTGKLISIGDKSGTINISGRAVVEQGTIDASGITNGGEIKLIATEGIEQTAASSIKADAPGGQAGTVRAESQGSAYLSGTFSASGATGGEIVLEGGLSGIVENSGTLDVSSANGQGGRIVVTGERVLIKSGSHLTASGATGGGEVLVGGSWQNSDHSVRQAMGTIVAQGALLEASATDNGNGGTVVAWSDVTNPLSVTRAYGTFEAKGGPNGGDGGRIETSGHWLDSAGVKGSTFSYLGRAGVWLFDPYDVTISASAGNNGAFSSGTWTPTGDSSNILNTDINSLLNTGTNVTVTTGAAGSQGGDITATAPIAKTTDGEATLTLKAARHIDLQSGANISSTTGKLNVQLWADSDNSGGGNIAINAALSGTGQTVTLTGGNGATVSGSGNITATNLLLNGSGANYTLNTATGNSVGTLAASTGAGNVSFINGANLTVGTVGGISGITTSGSLSLKTTSGGITGSGNIGAASVSIDQAGDSSYSGVISGSGTTLTKTGSGTLTLSGANTYTGATSISVGTLKLGNNSALGTADAGATVSSGATLDLNGFTLSTAEALTLNGTGVSSSGALSNSSATAATAVGNITLTGATTINNTGGLTLSGTMNGSQALTIGGTGAIALNGIVGGTTALTSLTIGSPASRKSTTLGANITTVGNITIDGDTTLGQDITVRSGMESTYSTATTFAVPAGITNLAVTAIGGAGGKGGNDGGYLGGDGGPVGTLTASFGVTGGSSIYLYPGTGGATGVSSSGSAAGGAGGSNTRSIGTGGTGGIAGPWGSSGGGGAGATLVSLVANPTSSNALLIAGGGGGGGGSGNNAICPGQCAGQDGGNYLSSGNYNGQLGANSKNTTPSGEDGGASGGGGGGLRGGMTNPTVFNVNEWTGRGGNRGESGVLNGFGTTSLSTATTTRSNGQSGEVTVSYGGGTIAFNGTVNGSRALTVDATSGDVKFVGVIGGTANLSSLSVSGAGGIAINGGAATTTGAQTYDGKVTLGANTTTLSTSNAAVTLGGDVVRASGVTGALTVSAGSGAVAANGAIGESSTRLGAVSITSTGLTTLAGAVRAASLTKSGTGRTDINGGLVDTTAGQQFEGQIGLGGNTQLSANGNVVISGALSNGSQSNLTVSAGSGDVTFAGNLAVGATSGEPTRIGDVSVTSTGAVAFGSVATPVSILANSLVVSANTLQIKGNTGTSFNCVSATTGTCLLSSSSFTVGGTSEITGVIAGSASITKAGAGTLTLSGASTYTGTTTVSAGTLSVAASTGIGSGNIVLGGGTLEASGDVDLSDRTVTVTADSTISAASTKTISGGVFSASGHNLNLIGGGNFTLTNGSNDFDTVTATAGKNITLIDSNAMTLGAITSTGTVDIATLTDNLTLTGVVQTTDANASAIKLNAAKNTAAGTSTGGNLIVNGGSIAVGSGGFATLYSGSVSGSTGLTTLVGSGSGRFRYNSDEATTNYTTLLTAGTNAIYREKPTLIITADNKTVTYGTTPTLTSSVAGVNGDTAAQAITTSASIAVSGSLSSSNNYTAGSHTLTPSGAASGLGYRLSYTDGSLTVNKKTLSLNLQGQGSKVYDATTSISLGGITPTLDGVVTSDSVTLGAGLVTGFADKNVGNNKPLTFSGFTLSNTDALNYELASGRANSTANITKAALTITAATNTKTYDATTAAAALPTTAGLQGSDTVTGLAEVYTDKNAGSGKTLNVSAYTVNDGNSGNNYTVTTAADTTGVITARNLTAAYTGTNKVYDATTTATVTGSSTDIITGDTVTFGQTANFDNKNAGTAKTINVAGITLGGTDSGNYALTGTTATTTADITRANLSITANDDSKTYSGAPYRGGNGVVYAGFVGGETSSVLGGTLAYGGTSQGAVNAGAYGIDPSGLTSGNYTIRFVNGVLTIIANPAMGSVDAALTSAQNSSNSSQQGQGNNAGTSTPSAGPGAGSTTLTTIAGATLVTPQTGGNVVLSSNTFSTPVTMTTTGQTTTMVLGRPETSGAPVEVGTLPVFTQSGNAPASLQGNFVVRQSSNTISLIQTTVTGTWTAPQVTGAASGSSASFTLVTESGMRMQLTASVSKDGVLTVIAPASSGSIDVKQAILMGTQVARQELNVELSALKSALFIQM